MSEKEQSPSNLPSAKRPQILGVAAVESASRRTLLRGGAAIAPILLAATPRSVMAGTCTSCSAFTSVLNMTSSHSAAVHQDCQGRLPSTWRDSDVKTTWPTTCQSTATACGTMYFNTVCGGGYADTTTMMNILRIPTPTVKDQLAQYIVAAVLNKRKGWVPDAVATEATLKEMWKKAGMYSGWYEPTAGVKWYANYSKPKGAGGGCIAWLKSTMS